MVLPAVLAQLIPTVIPLIGDALGNFIPDEKQKQAATKELEKVLLTNVHNLSIETVKTNQIEAGHRSIWVSGWRPSIGWVCSVGLGWLFIGEPLVKWGVLLAGYNTLPIPELPTDILLELTLVMLGMSGLRTFEKLKGISK